MDSPAYFTCFKVALYKRLNSIDDAVGINVKNYGAVGDGLTDDTAAIQLAIDSIPEGTTLNFPNGDYMIDAVGTNWNKMAGGGLIVNKSLSIKMDYNANLKAIANDSTGYSILTITDTEGFYLQGGKFTGDKGTHSGTSGEWGQCIVIKDSKDIIIKDTHCVDGWGDGIYVYTDDAPGLWSENILIDNVVLNNNRRNALTLKSVKNVTLLNSTFSNTSGTMPEAGIDIEPDSLTDMASDIVISGCKFYGNNHQDIVLGGGVGTKDLKINNCNFDSEDSSINAQGVKNAIQSLSISDCSFSTKSLVGSLANIDSFTISSSDFKSTRNDRQGLGFIIFENVNLNLNNSPLIVGFSVFLDIKDGGDSKINVNGCNFLNIHNGLVRTENDEIKLKAYSNTLKNSNIVTNPKLSNSELHDNIFDESVLRGSFKRGVIKNNTFINSLIRSEHLDGSVVDNNIFYNDDSAALAIHSRMASGDTKTESSLFTNNKIMYSNANAILVDPEDIKEGNYNK